MKRCRTAAREAKIPVWVEPRDLAEAKKRRQQIADQLLEVEARLASRNITDQQGRRLTGSVYWELREQLVRKKMAMVREIQRLKAYIAKMHTDEASKVAGISPDAGDQALLLRAYHLFQQLKREDVDFDPPELAFMDVLGKRVGLR